MGNIWTPYFMRVLLCGVRGRRDSSGFDFETARSDGRPWYTLNVDEFERITIEPGKCGGQPCIRGLRIRVIDILDLLGAGLTPAEVVEELPDLEPEDVTQALRYASQRLGSEPAVA